MHCPVTGLLVYYFCCGFFRGAASADVCCMAIQHLKHTSRVRAPPRVGALRARSRLCSSNKLVVQERSLLVGRALAAPWHTALPRWIAASAFR